jgi:hypothetical protein
MATATTPRSWSMTTSGRESRPTKVQAIPVDAATTKAVAAISIGHGSRDVGSGSVFVMGASLTLEPPRSLV